MDSPLIFYAKLLALFAGLLLVVGFNVAVWGLLLPTRLLGAL